MFSSQGIAGGPLFAQSSAHSNVYKYKQQSGFCASVGMEKAEWKVTGLDHFLFCL